MKRNRGFTPLIILILVAAAGVAGYFAYKNVNVRVAPERTPTCQVNCPDSIPTPKPGSNPGWVKYENANGKISFEYPEDWFYLDQQIGSTLPGLYALNKDKIVALYLKPDHYSDDFHSWKLLYDESKLSDHLEIEGERIVGGNPKIVSTNHYYFEKTNVITYKFCNTESMFVKGATIKPYEECATTNGYIDMGSLGFIMVAGQPMKAEIGKENELALYKKILSTLKFTN